MTAGELPAESVVTAEPDTPIRELADIMDRQRVGSVVIIDSEHRTLGVVTDRDLALRALTKERDPDRLTAGDVMTGDAISVEVSEGFVGMLQTMKQAKVRRLPLTRDGQLVDMITFDDIIRTLVHDLDQIGSVLEFESPRRDIRPYF